MMAQNAATRRGQGGACWLSGLAVSFCAIALLPPHNVSSGEGLSHYEDRSGAIVSRVRSFSEESAETGAAKTRAVEVILSSGKRARLYPPQDVTRLWRLSKDGMWGEPSEAALTGYLKSLPVFGYDPSSQRLMLARAANGSVIEAAILKVDRADGESFHLSAEGAGDPGAFNAATLALVKKMLGPEPVEVPAGKTSDQQSVKDKEAFFRKARNHPPSSQNIQGWTKPMKVPEKFFPKVANGTLYSGVLKKANLKNIVITTWDGDISFQVRLSADEGIHKTQLRLEDSPETSGNAQLVGLDRLERLTPGQFVSVYANGQSMDAVYISIYRRSDR